MRRLLFTFPLILLGCSSLRSAEPTPRSWTIGGDRREAMVYAPERSETTATPVVLVFHGHGGTMRNAMRTFALHKHWPEAIVVYPQGLNTPGQLTDPEGKRSGWQSFAGQLGDRDLKFVDTILKDLSQERKVDPDRIYATGHSNGGGFTYLLWAHRGDTFAALAPSAAVGLRHVPRMKPKPVLHIAGEADELVRYPMQKRMIDSVRRLNGCETGAKPWHDTKWCSVYASKTGTPVVTLIHPGGHRFEPAASATIVRFFKEHRRKPANDPKANPGASNREPPEAEKATGPAR